MKVSLWMFSVFFFLIFIAPALMVMMILVFTSVPMGNALVYYFPVAVAGTVWMSCWYRRQGRKQVEP